MTFERIEKLENLAQNCMTILVIFGTIRLCMLIVDSVLKRNDDVSGLWKFSRAILNGILQISLALFAFAAVFGAPFITQKIVASNDIPFESYEGWWARDLRACVSGSMMDRIAIGRFHLDGDRRIEADTKLTFGEGMEMIATAKSLCLITDKRPLTDGFIFRAHCLRKSATKEGIGYIKVISHNEIQIRIRAGSKGIGLSKTDAGRRVRCAPHAPTQTL